MMTMTKSGFTQALKQKWHRGRRCAKKFGRGELEQSVDEDACLTCGHADIVAARQSLGPGFQILLAQRAAKMRLDGADDIGNP
ncbi:hypothetical protein BH11ACT1_BH11ACT1_13070 [soil metagenome]